MANQKLNFVDFETEQLSKSQQKKVRGGDSPIDPINAAEETGRILLETPPTDPAIGTGKGMG
ncbi:hypothetical protein [Flavobacterium hibernum]|uniref:Uncharacterized protein n=1 Tax=Flavobacterium hibernum TaxID=37752 RepID=A0A0D0EFD7_9FLAO|nr:hypothetical protein [Flavobacterium hibernum]KIO53924.1 hypothetical protein IW18_06195 [Flavobacterium hibernum]OXA83098.1 hypothetical protein B0A73_22560 [Flavobacterium hibernum]STO14732.1 Uncharacterised protein [Flavobacterium hibernum]